jgi:hypothetical protein
MHTALLPCPRSRHVELATEAFVLDMGLFSIPGFAGANTADAARLLPPLPSIAPPAPRAAAAAAAAAAKATAGAGGGTAAQRSAGRVRLPQLLESEHGKPPSVGDPPAGSTAIVTVDSGGSAAAVSGGGSGGPGGWLTSVARASLASPAAAAAAAAATAAAAAAAHTGATPTAGVGCVRFYQVLAPRLAGRAALFGNRLALRSGCTLHDLPYYCAPGAARFDIGDDVGLGSSGRGLGLSGRRNASGSTQPGALTHHASSSAAAATLNVHSGSGLAAAAPRHHAGGSGVTSLPGSSHPPAGGSSTPGGDGTSFDAGLSLTGAALPSSAAGPPGVASPFSQRALISATGLPEPDQYTTFVFASVAPSAARSRLSAEATGHVCAIVSRVVRQCLLAMSGPPLALGVPGPAGCQQDCSKTGSGGSCSDIHAAGYLCREMTVDMKYLLVFSSPRVRHT